MRTFSPSLSPELLDWWAALRALPQRLGKVALWRAADHTPDHLADHHLHATATTVVCLRGAVRVSHHRQRVDLAPGEALVIQAGAWHCHEPLRPGTVVFQQGVLRGRSDFWFAKHDLSLIATVPEEPSHRLMAAAARTPQEARRRHLFAELLTNLTQEAVQPLTTLPEAITRMDEALWRLMSTPGSAAGMLRASGISRSRAYRLYVQHRGVPPAQALREERLTLAAALLDLGIPVAEAASRSGFASRQAFSRAFTQWRGASPRQHRGKPG
jgi:AraC-like DNA-binding protein